MTKITKEAFYCALAIGILGTYNSMFEAKAAAAPEGAGPVAPAVPEARDTGAKFGMVNGGYSYDEALKISRGELRANADIRGVAEEQMRNVRTAMDRMNNFDKPVFKQASAGLEKEEIYYELLNWPEGTSRSDKLAMSFLSQAERDYLLEGVGQISFQSKIAIKIGNLISNLEKAALFNLKVNRAALEEVLNKLRDVDRRTNGIIENCDREIRRISGNTEHVVKAFTDKLNALRACNAALTPIRNELNNVSFERIYDLEYNRIKTNHENTARDHNAAHTRSDRIFKIFSEHLTNDIAQDAINKRKETFDKLISLLAQIAADFQWIISTAKVEEGDIVEMCFQLADIALECCNIGYTPLSVFVNAGIFNALNNLWFCKSEDGNYDDEHAKSVKRKIYNRFLESSDPHSGVIRIVPGSGQPYASANEDGSPGWNDWDNNEEHRKYTIAEPSPDNGWWNPQKMSNMAYLGHY